MPLDKLVLILVIVLIAAGLTVWLGALVAAWVEWPRLGLTVAIPVALVLYVVWRVIADRLRRTDDDRYDRTLK